MAGKQKNISEANLSVSGDCRHLELADLSNPNRDAYTFSVQQKLTTAGGKLLIRVSETARLLDISRSLAYQLVASGDLPSIRIGKGAVRVPVEALREWMAEQLSKNGVPLSRR